MSVIDSAFDWESVLPHGHSVPIDDDRRVTVIRTAAGSFGVFIKNGDGITRLGLTREAGEALFDCLGASMAATR